VAIVAVVVVDAVLRSVGGQDKYEFLFYCQGVSVSKAQGMA
jgi:hypothetical protein